MSGPVKFGEKSQIIKPGGNHPYYFLERLDHVKIGYQIGRVDLEPSRRISFTHRDTPKTEKICMSGPVKFGEKSQIIKPGGNHPYYFLERLDHVKQDIRLVGSI